MRRDWICLFVKNVWALLTGPPLELVNHLLVDSQGVMFRGIALGTQHFCWASIWVTLMLPLLLFSRFLFLLWHTASSFWSFFFLVVRVLLPSSGLFSVVHLLPSKLFFVPSFGCFVVVVALGLNDFIASIFVDVGLMLLSKALAKKKWYFFGKKTQSIWTIQINNSYGLYELLILMGFSLNFFNSKYIFVNYFLNFFVV